MLLVGAIGALVSLQTGQRRSASAAARLNSAAEEFHELTDGSPEGDQRRAAIAWGYAERLRLGLESPFRLIEASARDPRLRSEERRTVSWALLAHVLRGETHQIDAAALDFLGPNHNGRSATGEQHLELITDAIARADDPRAAELAVRMSYTLASAERLVEGSAPQLAAEAAALLADREVARREAGHIVRSARRSDPIDEVRRRRAARSFYVERPVLLDPSESIEREAIAMIAPLLDSLRVMRPSASLAVDSANHEDAASNFSAPLFEAGAAVPPAAPLVVTVRRYASVLRAQPLSAPAFARIHNAEMLAASVPALSQGAVGPQRRALARLLLAAGVSMRSLAQEPVWFLGDSVGTPLQVSADLGLRAISFDRDVPAAWRPYYLRSLTDGVRDLRRVLPTLRLDAVQVRFRLSAPADSALAMHDPRTRTLHLPVLTAGGTLTHEVAHDLDRRSAEELGLPGYRSDNVARNTNSAARTNAANGRLAASLRAITEEASDLPRATRAQPDRPAEIFATRVDWFVAKALARHGIASGYLSAVQDELLTGHVVHPDRLRNSGRSRSLLTALTEMTPVASFAAEESVPSVQTLLRWSLAGPVDRRVAAEILRGDRNAFMSVSFSDERSCEDDVTGRGKLIRMAAESRARGWLRLRARWMSEAERTPWARAILGQGPWSSELADQRVAELLDYVLVQLTSSVELPAGLGAYATPLVARARCSN
jgi:hypothetical protein